MKIASSSSDFVDFLKKKRRHIETGRKRKISSRRSDFVVFLENSEQQFGLCHFSTKIASSNSDLENFCKKNEIVYFV